MKQIINFASPSLLARQVCSEAALTRLAGGSRIIRDLVKAVRTRELLRHVPYAVLVFHGFAGRFLTWYYSYQVSTFSPLNFHLIIYQIYLSQVS